MLQHTQKQYKCYSEQTQIICQSPTKGWKEARVEKKGTQTSTLGRLGSNPGPSHARWETVAAYDGACCENAGFSGLQID